MSRIGKQPIKLLSGVTLNQSGDKLTVKGPKGELKITVPKQVKVTVDDQQIVVERLNDLKSSRALHGLTRNLIANMVIGVSKGFEKKLEILGVGYRANLQGKKLVLSLGFSHTIEFTAPEGITISIDQEKKNLLTVAGSDKQQVGETAAKIRSYRKPEPYKGKGIRYQGERVQTKAGKAAGKDK